MRFVTSKLLLAIMLIIPTQSKSMEMLTSPITTMVAASVGKSVGLGLGIHALPWAVTIAGGIYVWRSIKNEFKRRDDANKQKDEEIKALQIQTNNLEKELEAARTNNSVVVKEVKEAIAPVTAFIPNVNEILKKLSQVVADTRKEVKTVKGQLRANNTLLEGVDLGVNGVIQTTDKIDQNIHEFKQNNEEALTDIQRKVNTTSKRTATLNNNVMLVGKQFNNMCRIWQVTGLGTNNNNTAVVSQYPVDTSYNSLPAPSNTNTIHNRNRNLVAALMNKNGSKSNSFPTIYKPVYTNGSVPTTFTSKATKPTKGAQKLNFGNVIPANKTASSGVFNTTFNYFAPIKIDSMNGI
ncbi:hypothetical protein KG892_01740 [Vermiphilus pyriformis]|nr:MAG: hypothetical protein KG892_01740 [Vermiphilus pyriformis]